jgi:hypothetical protein
MMLPRTRRSFAVRTHTAHRGLRIEPLETRDLLSVQPAGGEFRVNSYTQGDQSFGDAANYAAASDADGDRVVAWSSNGQDGDSWGIYAQRYTADGSPIGAEFRVNTTTAGAQLDPAVAIDPDGDFVVAWSSHGQDGDGFGIYAQRFNAAGAKQGNEFRVNATTAGDQTAPAVAMDAAGNFAVAWSSPQDGDQEGIVARLFDNAANAIGGEIQVNATTAGRQSDPVVARSLDCELVIAWVSEGQDGDGAGVVARRFDAVGAPLESEFTVNQHTPGNQNHPALVMARDGAFVVAWESTGQDGDGQGIVLRRYGADGTPAGDETIANTTTAGDQSHPTLALGADGGAIVAWTSRGQDGDGAGVYAQMFGVDGTTDGGELLVNTTTASDQERPTIALDARGDFVIAWQSANQDGDGLGVFAQRYARDGGDAAPPLVGGVYLGNDPHRLRSGERLVHAPTELVVSFSEAMSELDGALGATSVLNPANYRLTLFGADYSSAISSVSYAFNAATHRYEATLHFSAPLPRGEYRVEALPTLADANQNALDGDWDGATGGGFAMDFDVAELLSASGETAVNTTTVGDQAFTIGAPGTIAVDDAGNYAITWASLNQDGSGWGIYAQRFDAAGEKLGGEFRVNTRTTNHQRFSTIAMDADGDFVIVWSSLGQDGNNYGVYGQRYDAAGTAVGGEFHVNTTTASFQGRPSIAMDDDGDFVVVWESIGQDGDGVGIYYQQYGADGAKRGAETRANAITVGNQRVPHVAMDSDGDFVITWSGPNDGSGDGIFARRFNADGVAQGDETFANTLTAGNQQNSTVAMDDDGDYVVAWHSSTGDGVFYGVYAQRFTAQGEKFGEQFLVNSFTANFQQYPSIAMDANGDFLVTWQSLTQDGSFWGVYGQRYSWGGGRVGNEFQIHTNLFESQNAPNAAMAPNGDFIVAWQDMGHDGSGWGIYSQRYAGQTNHAPLAMIANAHEVVEGEAVTLDASASTDADFGQTLAFAWDLNNDGVFEDVIGATPTLMFAELAALGLQQTGVYAISVRADDGYGGTHTASSTLTIKSVAPSGITLDPLADVNEGAGVMLTGSFVDPSENDEHTLTIEWGDGTQDQFTLPIGERTFQIGHTYRDDTPTGTTSDALVIRVRIADNHGGVSEPVETSVVVHNIPPTVEDLLFSKIVLDEGESFTVSGRVSDAGADDTHTVTFHWGNGNDQVVAVDPVTRLFSVVYAFPDDDPTGTAEDLVHFTFTLADDDLGTAFTDAAVTVRNVAPKIVELEQSATTIDEGGTVTVAGRLDDPGVNDVLSLEIHWGDGQITPVEVDPVTRMFIATHTYADDDPTGTSSDAYAIVLSAADDDLGTAQAELAVTVNNVAPTAEIDISPTEPFGRREITLQALVADAGLLDTFTYRWEVRLGEELFAEGTEGQLRFTPNASGTYVITLEVQDDDGGITFVERSIEACVVAGDVDGNCVVDLDDLNQVRNYFGIVRDSEEWRDYVGPLPGDANGDDKVDLEDLNLVRNNFGASGEARALNTSSPAAAKVSTPVAAPRVANIKAQATDAVFAGYALAETKQSTARMRKPR